MFNLTSSSLILAFTLIVYYFNHTIIMFVYVFSFCLALSFCSFSSSFSDIFFFGIRTSCTQRHVSATSTFAVSTLKRFHWKMDIMFWLMPKCSHTHKQCNFPSELLQKFFCLDSCTKAKPLLLVISFSLQFMCMNPECYCFYLVLYCSVNFRS